MTGRPANTFHRYPTALQVVCPRCGAPPATPCRSSTGQRSEQLHARRLEVAGEGPRASRRRGR